MRNQFAGTCYRCGLPVPAGTGYFEKVKWADRKPGDPKWRTQHCYRTHNGGITCEMAKAAARKAQHEQQNDANDFYARGEHMPGVTS